MLKVKPVFFNWCKKRDGWTENQSCIVFNDCEEGSLIVNKPGTTWFNGLEEDELGINVLEPEGTDFMIDPKVLDELHQMIIADVIEKV